MITIKSVKISDFMSEETICFTANVYENGKKIGYADNEGHGGNTNIHLDNPRSKSYLDIEKIEEDVDELVYALENERQSAKMQKKLDKDFAKSICVGRLNENGASYYTQGFKSKAPLADIVRLTGGLFSLQSMVDRIKTELKGDETILNTNLESLGVKI